MIEDLRDAPASRLVWPAKRGNSPPAEVNQLKITL